MSSIIKKRILFTALMLVMALGLCSCGKKVVGPQADPAINIVWPSPPDPPKIRFVSAFSTPLDLGIKEGFFKRASHKIFGRDEQEGLDRPHAITGSGNDMLLVTDTGSGALHIFNLAKARYNKVTHAGKEKLITPVGVGIANEKIIVSDSTNAEIYNFDLDGKYLGVFTKQELERPTGIAVDHQRNLVAVADSLAHKIYFFDYDGSLKKTSGGQGIEPGSFNSPTHLAYDKAGNLYVADAMNFRVQIFSPDGALIAVFGKAGDGTGNLAHPKGVALDGDGNIYVVEGLFDVVQIFDRKGTFLLGFGHSGKEPGEFWLPTGIYSGNDDKIYVADSYNHRVQIFQYLSSNKEVPE